jgi:hypothetical protein
MPSPFPGMNPLFEGLGRWRSFHSRYINRASERLAAAVRPRYVVEVEGMLSLSVSKIAPARLHPSRTPAVACPHL